jgi:hypothetical protein
MSRDGDGRPSATAPRVPRAGVLAPEVLPPWGLRMWLEAEQLPGGALAPPFSRVPPRGSRHRPLVGARAAIAEVRSQGKRPDQRERGWAWSLGRAPRKGR